MHHDSLSTPNFPAVCFPATAEIVVPTNAYPDAAVTDIVIPLRVKSYTMPQAKTSVEIAEAGPLLHPSSFSAMGGKKLMHGMRELPKLSVEGEIDTPFTETDRLYSTVTANSVEITYAHLIQLFVDGQLDVNTNSYFKRQDPLWFRDPYGRVYNNPRVLDYTASLVEQVPFRTTFTLQMKV